MVERDLPMLSVAGSSPSFDCDVECDWSLLSTCNYRCCYCFLSADALGARIETFATPAEWAAAFDRTGLRWLVHLTGGEPTIHPDFVELCACLTRHHFISINTNLSRPAARLLVGRVDPRRVSFVNAGLHVDERQRRGGLDAFLDGARFLQDAGFRVFPTVVATPGVVADWPLLVSWAAERELQLAPKVLRGRYLGRVYPGGYSPEEKERLLGAIARARDHYDRAFAGWPRPSIDVLSDDELLAGEPNFRGRPCSAGFRFVSMSPNGDVRRCNPGRPSIGNLLRGPLRLGDGLLPCDTSYCAYFCRKYSVATLTPRPSIR